MEFTIKTERLTKSYGGRKVLNNLSFTVGRGEVFGLLGANGAGKSTAVECMLGTRKPDSGFVRILDMNPLTERRKLFEHVGVQFQESSFQDRITVSELCEETQSLYRESTDYRGLLDQFGLREKSSSPVNELSGGQKQRLFIVLALIVRPEVVFLDELTTGLDAKARRGVWKRLSALKTEGLTILLTSHFMDEVETLCDRILILKQGETVFHGTVKEAVDSSPCDSLEDAYLWYTKEENDENF